jgi:hypothetical protein
MNDLETRAHRPEFADKKATKVRVFTPGGIVEGDYYHPPGVRLSDSLRNAATGERYMLLTDVTIKAADGTPIANDIATAPFILINTAHASVIIPLEEE